MANWILFGVFALVVIINAVVGLVRGLNKSMIRLIMVVLSVGMTYLLAGPITTLITDSITVEGLTLGEMILQRVNSDGSMDMIFSAVPLLPELIKVVPAFVVALVVFPVVFMFVKFTSWIAYLIAQKHIRKLLFKETRTKAEYKELPKNKRLISRFSGLGVGIVTGMIIFGMVFTPLFGMFGMLPSADAMNNVIDSMVQKEAMTQEDAALVQEIYAVTDGGMVDFYGFFGTKAAGKAYLNGVTRVELDGVRTSLGNELGNMLGLMQMAIQSGLLTDLEDPNAIYALLDDPAALENLMQTLFRSEMLRATVPDLMASAMKSVAAGMNMPADKNAVYDNMMDQIAVMIRTADIDYAAMKAYEDKNASAFSLSLLAAKSGSDKVMTQAQYEAAVAELVELADRISKALNTSLSGDNKDLRTMWLLTLSRRSRSRPVKRVWMC